jgi:hypothetical protein
MTAINASGRLNFLGRCAIGMDKTRNPARDQHPGYSPENELVSSNEAFATACAARIAQYTEALGWEPAKFVVTESEKWGLVWRADYRKDSSLRRSWMRIVCWQQRGERGISGTAYGSVPATERFV